MMPCIRRALRFGGESRSVGAQWRPPEAHKPGRQSPAVGGPVGGPGAGGAGRNGPGPPVLPGRVVTHRL